MPPDAPDGLWIVVPAYNEGRRIAATLQAVRDNGFFPNVVVVDDGSADDSGEKALAAGAWVVRHAVNLGAGAAMVTGLRFALSRGAKAIVTFDSDGQHRADEIAAVAAPVLRGEVDVSMGSRFLGRTVNMPFSRRLVLKAGILFTWAVSGIRLTDTHNGFRALSRHAAETIRLRQNRMAHGSELYDEILAHKLSYCEVPVTIHYTADTLTKGQSSWNALRIVGSLLMGRMVR